MLKDSIPFRLKLLSRLNKTKCATPLCAVPKTCCKTEPRVPNNDKDNALRSVATGP